MIAFIGSISCLTFNFLIYYLQCSAELNYDFWDSLSITTSDFTAQVTFNDAVWKNWKRQARKDGVKLEKFKAYFQESIERQVNDLPKVSSINERDSEEMIRVSSIFFAYNNSDLIKALMDRGQKLSVGKYHENAKLEANILEMIELNED